MKKIIGFISTLVILMSLPFTVFADSVDWTSEEKIKLAKGQNQFEVEFSVNKANPYAGAEFGLQLPEGVKVKSVTYGIEASKAGPTEGRGLTWFSFFSGDNNFSGEVKATAILEYTGTENTSIVLDNISLYTTNGSVVNTEAVNPRKVITINREGATNTVTPPPAPLPEDNKVDDDKEVDNSNQSNSENNSNLNSSSNNSTTNNSTNKNIATNKNNSEKSSSKNNANKTKDETYSKSQGDNNNNSNNNSENKSDNNIQNNNSSSINPVIIIVLVISICANAVLGYFIIKNKNNKQKGEL